jgi:hypothetical protein
VLEEAKDSLEGAWFLEVWRAQCLSWVGLLNGDVPMGRFYDELNESLREFIQGQHIFFNASAPSTGRINVSPKGLDCFRILDNKRVAYLDLTGGESETTAHIMDNGRLTLMFCSFDAKPMILRLYGKGWFVRPVDARWKELHALFPSYAGERQIVGMDIESIMTTCGFAVPRYEFKGHRDTLEKWAETKGEEGLEQYRREKNAKSIDGLNTFLFDGQEK